MADTIRRVDYYYITVPDRPGEGARVLAVLKKARINLLAFSGFPKGRQAQLDLIPQKPAAFLEVARMAKWKLSPRKTGFLVQGRDRVGACADFLGKLAAAKINVTAVDAVSAGAGRYGAIFWVKARDVTRAAKALGI
jgi:predicted amino acid-binding ACT domain protein